MNKINVKGIIIGLLTLLAIDCLGAIIIVLFTLLQMDGNLVNENFSHEPQTLILSLILGSIATLFGGFVAARFKKENHYLNSGIIGVIGTVLCLLLSGGYPLWFNAIAISTTLPLSIIGGHWIKRIHNSKK